MCVLLLLRNKSTIYRLLALKKKKDEVFLLVGECFVAESNFNGLIGNPEEISGKTN